MQFLNPEWFRGFWLVLAVVLFYLSVSRRKKALLTRFAHVQSIATLTRSHSSGKEFLQKSLLISAFILILLALAQPQWGEIQKEVQRKGREIVFLVDTSLSMLAEDVEPGRIEKAKLEMKSFLRKLQGDRIGIVTFAGSGFVQSPLTLDYDAFLLFANALQVGYIPDVGTSLSEAIQTAIKSFPETKQKHQAIVLLSDGEHLEGDVETAIREAQKANVRIYTIGIGTLEGAPIPLRNDQRKIIGYKKDRAGEIVITKLNEQLLKEIAKQTGALYSPATPGERELEWMYEHIGGLDIKEFKQQVVQERENHFQLFLATAIACILLEMCIGETKGGKAVEA